MYILFINVSYNPNAFNFVSKAYTITAKVV